MTLLPHLQLRPLLLKRRGPRVEFARLRRSSAGGLQVLGEGSRSRDFRVQLSLEPGRLRLPLELPSPREGRTRAPGPPSPSRRAPDPEPRVPSGLPPTPGHGPRLSSRLAPPLSPASLGIASLPSRGRAPVPSGPSGSVPLRGRAGPRSETPFPLPPPAPGPEPRSRGGPSLGSRDRSPASRWIWTSRSILIRALGVPRPWPPVFSGLRFPPRVLRPVPSPRRLPQGTFSPRTRGPSPGPRRPSARPLPPHAPHPTRARP